MSFRSLYFVLTSLFLQDGIIPTLSIPLSAQPQDNEKLSSNSTDIFNDVFQFNPAKSVPLGNLSLDHKVNLYHARTDSNLRAMLRQFDYDEVLGAISPERVGEGERPEMLIYLRSLRTPVAKRKVFWSPLGRMPASARVGGLSQARSTIDQRPGVSHVFRYGR